MIGPSSLASLPFLRAYRSKRSSSYDRTGGNRDFVSLKPGETTTLLETDTPGCIKHIWCTIGGGGPHFLRRIVVRMWWDGEENPSVESPIGDFFGLGFSQNKNYVSAPMQASPQDGRGMNSWWPMPFSSARIEVTSECDEDISLYFYVDYEAYDVGQASSLTFPKGNSEQDSSLSHPDQSGQASSLSFPKGNSEQDSSLSHPDQSGQAGSLSYDGLARFHCQWRRENPTDGFKTPKLSGDNIWDIWQGNPNTSGDGNYVILDAAGSGVYCGCFLHIDCFQRQANDWYGEGDDMIFIDGEAWPSSLHGTGTEDYFNMAFCPQQEICAPYHGLTLYSGNSNWPWKGKNSMYRFHIEDPIRFHESIRVTIEHGHGNKLSNDYSSTAYWYQLEPHRPFTALPEVEERLPRPLEAIYDPEN